MPGAEPPEQQGKSLWDYVADFRRRIARQNEHVAEIHEASDTLVGLAEETVRKVQDGHDKEGK